MSDVLILGAGPAGLTLGCALAREGVACSIVERAHHPRPHVGESLMPSTLRAVRSIGFGEVLTSADFPESGGVVYHAPDRKRVEVAYSECTDRGFDTGHTYHVDRAKFDMLLLKWAEACGCRILEGAPAEEVLFDDRGYASGVRVAFGGRTLDLTAKVVVDATGRATTLGRQLGLRRDHPVLRQFALHAWLEGVHRGPRRTERHTHVYFLPRIRGWAWQAPIHDDITSIGVVADRAAFEASGLPVEAFFASSLHLHASLKKATADAHLLNEIKGEVNYSYRLDRVCGDGWLAVGDAARFLDPAFSSGVGVAMRRALDAAELVRRAIEKGDWSRAAFMPYEHRVLTDGAIWDDFIRLFYRLLPTFTHLLETPTHRAAMVRMIQGEIDATSERATLEHLRSLVREVEEADEHPWKGDLVEVGVG